MDSIAEQQDYESEKSLNNYNNNNNEIFLGDPLMDSPSKGFMQSISNMSSLELFSSRRRSNTVDNLSLKSSHKASSSKLNPHVADDGRVITISSSEGTENESLEKLVREKLFGGQQPKNQ